MQSELLHWKRALSKVDLRLRKLELEWFFSNLDFVRRINQYIVTFKIDLFADELGYFEEAGSKDNGKARDQKSRVLFIRSTLVGILIILLYLFLASKEVQ